MTHSETVSLDLVRQHRETAAQVEVARVLLATVTGAQALSPTRRLGRQQLRLAELAALLQIPPQSLVLAGLDQHAQGGEADRLRSASSLLDQAEVNIRSMEQRVRSPLLPQAKPMIRAGLIYGGFAVLVWLVQVTLFVVTNGTSPAALTLSTCGLPILGFVASVLVLGLAGQPRVGPRHGYHLKLGAILFVLAQPVGWLLLVLFLVLIR